jgi:hypothetical protein
VDWNAGLKKGDRGDESSHAGTNDDYGMTVEFS